jgi:hypothetical protein
MIITDIFTGLLWFGAIYFIIDSWLLITFWNVKEVLVHYNILWIPMPFTGILYFKNYYEFVSSLPKFTPQIFYSVLLSIPLILAFVVFCTMMMRI